MNARIEEVAGRCIEQAEGDPRRWLALPVLLTGAFLPVLDFNVVNLALPAIRQALAATSSDVEFVISAYAATYAVFLVTGGRLGDRFGRKRMFVLGVAGFTVASALCGLAWRPDILIAARIAQGAAATLMAPQVLASIRVLFPPAEHGKAFALYGATFGLGNIVGQVLGGLLVSMRPFGLSWQAIFLINVPIGLAAIAGALVFLRDSRAEQAHKLDIGGVVLLSATLGLLVYPLVQGHETGWPAWILAMLALSPLALAAFVRVEKRVVAQGGMPLVDFSLFRNPRFATGVAMAFFFYMLSAFYLSFSIYLQAGQHLSARAAGLRMLPYAVGYFLTSLVSAGIMRRMGPRTLTLGFLFQVLGFGAVVLSVLGLIAGGLWIALLVVGLGFGLVMPSLIKAVIGGIDPRHAGLASGIIMSTLQISAALGVAIIGGIFFAVLGSGRSPADYAHAFAVALGCNVVLLAVAAALSLRLPRER